MDTKQDTIIATINATGAESTVPDNPGAVDATVVGLPCGPAEVTLLPDHTGRLVVRGPSYDLWNWLVALDDNEQKEAIGAIEEAVNEADWHPAGPCPRPR